MNKIPFDLIDIKTKEPLLLRNNHLYVSSSPDKRAASILEKEGKQIIDFAPDCTIQHGAYSNEKTDPHLSQLSHSGILIEPCYKSKSLLKELKTSLDGNANVVFDLGCSNCGILHFIPSSAIKIGIDISAQSLFSCKPSAFDSNVEHLWICDATRLPVPDAVADMVICCDILEHLLEPEILLKEAYRILRHGGLLITSVPNLVHMANRFSILAGYGGGIEFAQLLKFKSPVMPASGVRFPDQRIHLRWFTSDSLKKMLEGNGFGVIQQFGIGPIIQRLGLENVSKNLALLTAAIARKP